MKCSILNSFVLEDSIGCVPERMLGVKSFQILLIVQKIDPVNGNEHLLVGEMQKWDSEGEALSSSRMHLKSRLQFPPWGFAQQEASW
jgi:hypothetical protein